MKVSDLIKALEQCDPNAVVVKANNDYGASFAPLPPACVEQQDMVVYESPYSTLYYEIQDHNEDDENREMCVCLWG